MRNGGRENFGESIISEFWRGEVKLVRVKWIWNLAGYNIVLPNSPKFSPTTFCTTYIVLQGG